MNYKTTDFENAAQKAGYTIERIKKNEFNNVISMYGSVQIGTLTKQVRWNHLGHCFATKGYPLAKYNLEL